MPSEVEKYSDSESQPVVASQHEAETESPEDLLGSAGMERLPEEEHLDQ